MRRLFTPDSVQSQRWLLFAKIKAFPHCCGLLPQLPPSRTLCTCGYGEMADAPDLESGGATRGGSSPPTRTIPRSGLDKNNPTEPALLRAGTPRYSSEAGIAPTRTMHRRSFFHHVRSCFIFLKKVYSPNVSQRTQKNCYTKKLHNLTKRFSLKLEFVNLKIANKNVNIQIPNRKIKIDSK